MGLAEAQRLLARLATDAPLRARFADDPGGVADEFGLSPEEANRLAGFPTGPLEDFARSLVRKRRGEVESLLPLTSRAIGPKRLATLFRAHAQSFVPGGIKKHRDDAVAFAAFLVEGGEVPSWVADLARLEAAYLLAHDPSRRYVAVGLEHHPDELARAAPEGGPVPKPRPTWVAWFRLLKRGQVRRLVLGRPW